MWYSKPDGKSLIMTTGSTEQIQLAQGGIYLVKNTYFHNDTFQEMYVERISDEAYKFRKERSDGTWYIEWVEKKQFHDRNEVLELLDKPMIPPPLDTVKIEVNSPNQTLMDDCPVCNGMGQVPDPGTTGGSKSCPKCWGSGKTYKMILND